MRDEFKSLNSSIVGDIRGRGLMNCIEIRKDSKVDGNDFSDILRDHGVISKATKNYAVRFTPPLIITKEQVDDVVKAVDKSL